MATLKEIINYSKANPDTDYAKGALQHIRNGDWDEKAKVEGVDLSWAGRPTNVLPEIQKSEEAGGPAILTPLARPGQALGEIIGQTISKPYIQKTEQNITSMGNMVQKFLQAAHNETDQAKKSKLIQEAVNTTAEMKKAGANIADIQKQIQDAQRIKTPFGTIQPIETSKPKGKLAEEFTGTALKTIAFGLGPVAGGGALLGGEAMEKGGSAGKVAGMTVLGMAGGKVFDLVATPILNKALTMFSNTALGKLAVQSGGKVWEFISKNPVLTKNLLPQEFTNAVNAGANWANKTADYLITGGPIRQKIQTALTEWVREGGAVEKLASEYKKMIPSGSGKGYVEYKYDSDPYLIISKEGVPISGSHGKLDATDAINALTEKQQLEYPIRQQLLTSTGAYGSLDDVEQNAIRALTEQGTARQKAIDYIKGEIAAYKQQYAARGFVNEAGKFNLPIQDVDKIKIDLYGKGWKSPLASPDEKTIAGASRIMGNAAKNEVINQTKEIGGTQLQRLNEHYGELADAIDFLVSKNNSPLTGGRLGRYFARIMGAMIGSPAGIPGGVAGVITADKLIDIIQNPNVPTFLVRKILAKVQVQDPTVVQEAINIIKENILKQTSVLKLPPMTDIQLGGTSITDFPHKTWK